MGHCLRLVLGCRHLFADLQCGPRFSADPRSFAQALNLDHTIQQVWAATCTLVTCSSVIMPYQAHMNSSVFEQQDMCGDMQDGQEFLKLLLSLLEGKLSLSGQAVRQCFDI